MKKILMISPHFNLPGDSIPIGGVQRHIDYTTKEFLKRDYDIEWCYKRNAKKVIEDFKPDFIISHDFVSFIPDINIPQVTVFHGYEGNIPPLKKIVDVRQDIEKKSTVSICIGEYLKKWYGHEPDKVLWGGVEATEPIERPRNRTILYLGRLDPDQSPLMVFEGLGKTKEKYNIEVCGTGKLEPEVIQTAKKYHLSMKLHGFVNNPDAFIKKADIVLCSGYLTILESYINKRPVISAYGNELKKDYLELMPRHPVTCSTSEELADRIDKIYKYNSTDLIKNYEFAKNNTWKKVVDEYEELFKCIQK